MKLGRKVNTMHRGGGDGSTESPGLGTASEGASAPYEDQGDESSTFSMRPLIR